MNYSTTRYRNICKEGSTYRVRKMVNGKTYSRSFSKLKEAITYRDSILNNPNNN